MPDCSKHIADQIRDAGARRQKLKIVGHDSKHFLGRDTVGEELSLKEHAGVVSYKPAELVISVRAGTAIEEIDKVLSESGQMLASDPPKFDGKGSIGGSLACNLSGPGRPWTGSLRDAVLGVTIIDGRGESLKFGGQVMKNVAGYDVSRLQAGAMGCLGVIAEISLKVMPKPDATATVAIEMVDPSSSIRYINELCGTSLPITGACWDNGWQYVRFQGAGRAVEKAISEILQSRSDARQIHSEVNYWESLRDHEHDFFSSPDKIWRYSVKSTTELQKDGSSLVDWGGAQRWVRADGSVDNMAKECDGRAGKVSLFRGRESHEDVCHPMAEPLQQLHKGLKSRFDPDFLLNPGRLYSWL